MSRFNYKANSSFNDSDVSEADDDDIAKILRETESIDGAKRKPNLSKTQPSLSRGKSFNFDDDPLDDLDELIGKKHTNTSTKPPLASTMPTPAKPKIGFIFDDDDFDSKSKPKASDNNSSKQKTGLVDELFGKDKKEKSELKNDDDFLFGGYTPSVASNTPRATLSQPPAKRSVSFNDEDDQKPKSGDNLSKTTPGKLEFDFDFESLLKPKAKSQKNEDWMKEPTKFETSIDLDGSFNNPRRRNSQSGVADKPPIGFKTAPKDSMNSSFADSTENMEHTNQTNKNFSLGNLQPLTFDAKTEDKTDNPDKWFTNLITNKKSTNQPKKTNVSFNETNSDNFNFVLDQTILGDKNDNLSFLYKSNSRFNNSAINENKNLVNVESVASDHDGDAHAYLKKIKQLEYENQDLKLQLEHNKSNFELQIKLMKESCDSQVRILKDDRENSHKLFREEKESLQNHIDLVEKEKLDLTNVYKQKLDDKQKEFDADMEKLKQLHRSAVQNIKEENEQIVERIKHLKETELSAALAANSHGKTLENVISLIEDNTKNLDSMSHKVQMEHMVNMNEHQVQLRNKEEQLKLHEQRLDRQQKEYEAEIRNLNETIKRLEDHLAEQSKSVAEERWKGKQQEKKMEAFQEALINEQKIIMEKLARERNDIERCKDDILAEQKRLMQQVYEEKRKMAEERANLDASLNAYKEKKHQDSLNNVNIEAEISVSTKRLKEEKERLEKLKDELKEKEAELKQEKKTLDEKKLELEAKISKIDQLQAVLNQKYSDAEELYLKSNREKESNKRILDQVNEIKMNHDSRLNQIQQQMMLLNERETKINQEKINLYKLQQDIEVYKSNLKCSKCQEPVKELSFMGMSMQSSGYGTGFLNLYQSRLQSTMISQVNNSQLEDSKLLRQLKIQALKDRQFVNEEKSFIETLKSGSRSLSVNQLNSPLA